MICNPPSKNVLTCWCSADLQSAAISFEARCGELQTDNRCDEVSASASLSEFTEVNPLPCTKVQSAVGNGNGERYTHHARFGMRRHIRRSFILMQVSWVAIWNQSFEDTLQIMSHIRVEVLVQRQSATGMSYEEIQNPCLRQRRQIPHHLIGYEVKPARKRAQ